MLKIKNKVHRTFFFKITRQIRFDKFGKRGMLIISLIQSPNTVNGQQRGIAVFKV